MKRIHLLFMLCTLCGGALAQSTQRGRVMEYRETSAKVPMANVDIMVRGAGSNVSDKKGTFSLVFRTLRPGDKIDVVHIRKEGYEIFNQEALDAWRIANDGSQFTVVMCQSKRFKALKDKYLSIANENYRKQREAEERKLQAQLNAGKLQVEQYEKQMLDLERQYESQLKNIDNYIDRFARIDLKNLNGQDSAIVRLIQAGDFEGVIRAYEQQDNLRKYITTQEEVARLVEAQQKIEKARNEKEQVAQNLRSRINQEVTALYILGGSGNIHKIDSIYRRLATEDTLSCQNAWDYGRFLMKQHRSVEAEGWFRRALRYEMPLDQQAALTADLGQALVVNSKYEEYEVLSASIMDSVVMHMTQEPDRYSGVYISLCNSLSTVERNRGNFAMAMQYAHRSMDVRPNRMAATLLADIFIRQGRFDSAQAVLLTVLPSVRLAVEQDASVDNLISLAQVERNLARAYAYGEQLDSAADMQRQALRDYSLAARKDSARLAPYMADSYQDLAVTLSFLHQTEAALDTMSRSVAIKRALMLHASSFQKGNYCLALSNLGNMYRQAGRFSEAQKVLQEAMDLSRDLCQRYTTIFIYSNFRSRVLINQFALLLAWDKLPECEAMLPELQQLVEQVHQQDGTGYDDMYRFYQQQVEQYRQKISTP